MPANNATLQSENGRRLQPYFTAVCILLRESNPDATFNSIADDIGLENARSVQRFEKGESWPHLSLDTYAAAYARAGKLADPRQVYALSLDFWINQHSTMIPLTAKEIRSREAQPEPGLMELVRQIKAAGEIEQAQAEAEGKPTSKGRKRANGE